MFSFNTIFAWVQPAELLEERLVLLQVIESQVEVVASVCGQLLADRSTTCHWAHLSSSEKLEKLLRLWVGQQGDIYKVLSQRPLNREGSLRLSAPRSMDGCLIFLLQCLLLCPRV